jgi:hypothetical protein
MTQLAKILRTKKYQRSNFSPPGIEAEYYQQENFYQESYKYSLLDQLKFVG